MGQHREQPAAVHQYTITIVDDDPQYADLLCEFLTEEGYTITICAYGEQAFVTILEVQPDLIILDVRMTDIGGLAILYQLSTSPKTRSIPALICTGVSAGEMQQWREVLDEKGVPVLHKPFTLEHLANQIATMLGND